MALKINSGPLRLGSRGGLQIKTGGAAAFNPATYGTVAAWFKADAGLLDASDAVITADGTSIKTWQDQSGSGNHIVQATGANQPVAKNAIQNGLRVVRFSAAGTTNMRKAVNLSLNTPFCIFAVLRFRTAGTQVAWDSGAPDYFFQNGAAFTYHDDGFGDQSGGTSGQAWAQVTIRRTAAAGFVRVNGTQVATDVNARATGFTSPLVIGQQAGGSFSADLDLGEWLCFSTDPGTTNMATIEAALKARWGTP